MRGSNPLTPTNFLLNTSFLSEAFDCGQGLPAHSVSRSRMALASGIYVNGQFHQIFKQNFVHFAILIFSHNVL
jgi:hypothetical protein